MHTKWRIKLGVLAGVATASFALGCGGSDEGSEPLTKQAFVRQANAICEQGVKEKDRILEAGFKEISAGGKKPARNDLEELVLDVLPPIQRTTEQLAELSPPSEDEDTVAAFEKEYEEALQEAGDNPGSALSASFLVEPNTAAQKYGLTSCSL